MDASNNSNGSAGGSSSYRPVPLNEIPVDSENMAKMDLYVYLALQKRFVIYIPRGDKITSSRKEALSKHSVPCLYVKEEDAAQGARVMAPDGGNTMAISNFEVIGLPGNKALSAIFEDLSKNPDTPPKEAIARLEKMADEVLMTVAPDAANIKARFAQNIEYLWLMNDASAISTLATTFAAANGINALKPLRDVVFACLVMDLPLAKLEPAQIETYIRNPKDLPKFVAEQIEQHPFQAFQLAKKALPHLSDTTFELILTHHEKYNGEGYPRKLRSVQIFPLGQILACAVEIFERMKVANATDQNVLEKNLAHYYFQRGEPHMQRHRREIIKNVAQFLSLKLDKYDPLKPAAAAAAPGEVPATPESDPKGEPGAA